MSEEEVPESTVTQSTDASPDVQTPEAKASPKETDAKADAPTEPEKSEKDGEDTPTEPKPKSKGRKRIANLEYEARESRRREERLLKLLEKQQSQGADTKPPKIEDFETIDEYLDARDSHRDKQSESKDNDRDYGAEQEALTREGIDDLRLHGSDKYEDFEEVVFGEDIKISPVMRDAILVLDDPEMQADVAYFLGQNPKEASKIAKLSPLRQVTEIGKLEAKIASKPAPKRPSAAPKPIKPVAGAKTSATTGYDPNDDMATYMKKYRKEKAAQRG